MTSIASHKIGNHLFQTFNERPNFEDKLYEVCQVHSADIALWSETNLNEINSDGICFMFDQVSELDTESIHLAIKTADCLSVAIIGEKGAINLHAGWRGLADGILFHPLILSCEPSIFLLSAAIDESKYEVGREFIEKFINYSSGLVENQINKKLTFSLHKTALQMIRSQYPKAKILRDELDTFSHPDLNSFRMNKTVKRNWNVLSLNLRNEK